MLWHPLTCVGSGPCRFCLASIVTVGRGQKKSPEQVIAKVNYVKGGSVAWSMFIKRGGWLFVPFILVYCWWGGKEEESRVKWWSAVTSKMGFV